MTVIIELTILDSLSMFLLDEIFERKFIYMFRPNQDRAVKNATIYRPFDSDVT